MEKQTATIIGLMSGTSADGVDATLVEFSSVNSFKVKSTYYLPYPKVLSEQINQLAHSIENELDDQQLKQHIESHRQLDKNLVDIYADTCEKLIEKSNIDRQNISAVANHGQTIVHRPNATPAYSIQLGSGQQLANQLDIEVITQFRQADLEHGGQGAPLMPAFHNAICPHDRHQQTTVFLNLGGIGNLSIIGETIFGFDTGPANTLLNQWASKVLNKDYDENGEFAASGTVDKKLLKQLLKDPYFLKSIPKSTGPDYFNLNWLQNIIDDITSYKPADIQATLLELTIESIAIGLEQANIRSGEIYACGGGVQNQLLMQRLQQRLDSFELKSSDDIGVPADWVEAIGFAWLGYCKLFEIESNIPDVTGATKSLVLGQRFKPTEF